MTVTSGRERAATARHKRPVHHHWVLGSLVTLVVVALAAVALWSLTIDRSGDAAVRTTPRSGAPASPSAAAGVPVRIELAAGATTARSMEAVPLIGRSDAAPGTELRVQLLERPGRWVDFPLPTVVDEAGRFRTYVELGGRGRHHVRVVDPASGAVSAAVAITVR